MRKLKFKLKCLLTILACLVLVAFFSINLLSVYGNVNVSADSVVQDENTTESMYDELIENTETVFSYKDILKSYYNQVADAFSMDDDSDISFTFDEFCEGYYQVDISIQDYTSLLINLVQGQIGLTEFYAAIDDGIDIAPMSSSSSVAYYILKNSYDPAVDDPEITPYSYFRSYPDEDLKESDKIYDLSVIKDGDIILETNTVLFNSGHTAFVYDTEKKAYTSSSGTDTETYIETIDAVSTGVSFGYLSQERFVDYGVVILRVTNESSVIASAKDFVYQQLGKKYSLPSEARVNYDVDSEEWYCSELINAAYFNAGINLDCVIDGYCLPFDIEWSSRTSFVCISNCVDLILNGKEDGKWKITVYNTSSDSITVDYNTKMCFASDAAAWSGLKNLDSVTLNPNRSVVVYISTNFFATSVAFSTVNSYNQRCITYGYNLSKASTTMSVSKNIIS
ncbi:MAG: hypothetical protein LUD50_06355 [Clostridia bacterium]|nr:hypothetical protein [Clostridia bacterium]